MAELKFELHSPLTEEDWDLITDVDLDHTPSVSFHTKHGKDVEYVKVKHGRWEQVEVVHDRKDAKIQDWQQAKCSVCGRWHTTPYMYYLKLDNYCPNCGAKMDEVEE